MKEAKHSVLGYTDISEHWKDGKRTFSKWLMIVELIRISKLPNTGIGIGYYKLKTANESKDNFN